MNFFNGEIEFENWLKLLIGENMEFSSNVKFTSKKENILKFFMSKNILSFTFKNYMKYYIILYGVIFFALFYLLISSLIKDEYDEKGQIIFGAKNYLFIIGPHIFYIIMIIILVFFHYYRRKIDIFIKGRTLFIGITTFCQKSYKKNIYLIWILLKNAAF